MSTHDFPTYYPYLPEASCYVLPRVAHSDSESRVVPPKEAWISRKYGSTDEEYLAAKAYADAERLLRESVALGKKHVADARDTHRAKSLLGAALLGQKKYAEAEPLLVHGFEGMEKLQSQEAHAVIIWRAEALERVVQLYVAWDKLDTAAEWRRKQGTSPRTK